MGDCCTTSTQVERVHYGVFPQLPLQCVQCCLSKLSTVLLFYQLNQQHFLTSNPKVYMLHGSSVRPKPPFWFWSDTDTET